MEQIINVGFLQNTYILEIDSKLVIIDPGFNFEKIVKYLGDKTPDLILLTHFHFDHVSCTNDLCDKYGIKAHINTDDLNLLLKNTLASSLGIKDELVLEKNIITFDKSIDELPSLKVIKAPGHSAGSVLFEYEEKLFTGDVLFIDSQGRTDLPGSNYDEQVASMNLFPNMDENLIVYAGHGRSGTLKNIIKNNNFFKVI